MEFAEIGGQKGYSRLMLGASPLVVAWPTLAMEPMTALIVQWVGFTSLWYADLKVTGLGWTPKWYSQYRFYLSILVGGWYVFFVYLFIYLPFSFEQDLKCFVVL